MKKSFKEVFVSDSPKPFDRASQTNSGTSHDKPARPTPLHPRRRGIIVGASSGIGAALARKLAKEGFTLALLGPSKESLDVVCDELNRAAGETRALPYFHDVSDHASVPELLTRVIADLGGLDVFVYMAGINRPPGGMDKYSFENDCAMVEINLIGAMAWLSVVAPMFHSAKSGQIVGISSVAADRGRVGNPGYNTSKAGLTTYLEALRNRLTRGGVNVLTVKPGFVKTDMLKAAQGATPFVITPEKAADDIYNAMRKRKQLIYTPSLWRWIMLAIQHTPSFIFRRLSF